MLTIGIQLYTLKNLINTNPKLILKKLADLGFKEIETYDFSKGTLWGLTPENLLKELKKNKLKSSFGHYGLESMLSGNMDEIKEVIETAKILDQKYIVIPSIPEHLRKTNSAYVALADIMNEAGEICKNFGLNLAYHNHSFEFKTLENSDRCPYEILLQHTDSKLVTFEIDIYWAYKSGISPVGLFENYPGRFELWHIKDMNKSYQELNTEIGNGSINFKELLLYKEMTGVKHFILEQENFEIPPYESLRKSLNYISKNLAI
ncbi:sugar phosphate isomerase/epimerase [Zunongwangia sp. SCSIO 43204]|uniref:sugar phosphate isomerase/epimerase family protein n=1 Tax=Zunongwangia sp. SCSIO 43204 TaxID=2779359 RepID=UPI001CAA20C5|nr:sugar phosphate isomerase/epimerase [Zunongwangia sp. SCSIO 43204]UAB83160.1 sugar phosphate isomerase/epimerase [Zunongwangia sp. SCSIO 43204]